MTTPNGPAGPAAGSAADDPLPEAMMLVRGASQAGYRLKILGGLGVRVLCPDFPPRMRAGQDMDLACLGKTRRQLAGYLESAGCQPDKRFNNLNGDLQMYFMAPSGRPIDVMVDRLSMCHTLDFRPSFSTPSPTLDPADLLLSKLQIFELNAKDAHDIIHLLSGVRVGRDATRPFIDTDRFGSVLAGDWGWWRTVTGNLAKLPGLIVLELVPGFLEQWQYIILEVHRHTPPSIRLFQPRNQGSLRGGPSRKSFPHVPTHVCA